MSKYNYNYNIKLDKYPNDKYIDEYDEKLDKIGTRLFIAGMILIFILIIGNVFSVGVEVGKHIAENNKQKIKSHATINSLYSTMLSFSNQVDKINNKQ